LSAHSSSNFGSSDHVGPSGDDQYRFAVSDEIRRFFECESSREAIRIITELRTAGFVAYLAGGCVRDALLGRFPKDYDVATDATPDSVRKVFGRHRTLAFGASFGVIGVLPEKSSKEQPRETVLPTEVATFRSDGHYSDGRRPDNVHYGTAEQDALRRDFTMNGMFYDPRDHCVIDFVGGQHDLHRRVLHTIGDAHQRFSEDKLRMLRAVRFATTLGFKLTSKTLQAIIQHAESISRVSGERIGAEMHRILASEQAIDGLRLLDQCRLDPHVLPQWRLTDPARVEMLLRNLPRRCFVRALACLLLNMPTDALADISRRWKLSGEEQRQLASTCQHVSTIIEAADLPWSQVQPVLVDRDVEVILDVAEAVAKTDLRELAGVAKARQALTWMPEELNPPPLLSGNDLAQLGYRPGPVFSKILKAVRDAQLDGQANSRADAERIASDLASS